MSDEFKSAGPTEIHPRVLKELAKAISKPLIIIFKNSLKIKSSQRPEERQVTE